MKHFDFDLHYPYIQEGGNSFSVGTGSKAVSHNDVLVELQNVLDHYLKGKKHRTLNSLSKKCKVSEPTLRRIYKGQIKTLPTATTILDILTNISGEKNMAAIARLYPGAIANYLENILPQSTDCETEYCSLLNIELKDSVKYIIYKISSNSFGLSEEKIVSLFGQHGLQQAEMLEKKGFLSLSNGVYFSKVKNFTINQENFISNFKLVADFIKTQSLVNDDHLHSLLANYSESVSLDVYKEIVALQKKTLKKIRALMSDENSKGPIPLFLLLAIDTLDSLPIHELQKQPQKP